MNWTKEQLQAYEARTGKVVSVPASAPVRASDSQVGEPPRSKTKVASTKAATAKATSRSEPAAESTRRHKFGAIAEVEDGHRFDSKVEHRYKKHLEELQRAGHVLFFLRQVPFHLPGGVRYVCDFQVFWTDGCVTFEDPKGMQTPEFKLKMRLMDVHCPWVCIELIDRSGRRRPATAKMEGVRQVPEVARGLSDPFQTAKPAKSKKGQTRH